MARHLAPAVNSPQSAIHRAMARATGRHGRRRMAGEFMGKEFIPSGNDPDSKRVIANRLGTAPALFGLEDHTAELAEVRTELSRPITQAVTA